MNKKILTISSIILLVILLGLAYYYFFIVKTSSTNSNNTNNPSSTNYFPFGQDTNTTTNNSNQTGTTTAIDNTPMTSVGDYLQKLRLITNEPVAGAAFVENKTGVYVRYIEKATGHIYDVPTFSANVQEISNVTIPKLYEAFFTEGGGSFIARYVDDDNQTIETLYGKIHVATSTLASTANSTNIKDISGVLLPINIDSLSVSPSGKLIFYIKKTTTGSVGVVSAPNGSGGKQIWDSKIKSVLSQFGTESQIFMTTKPNAAIYGYSYTLNAKTGGVSNVLANYGDLSVLANPAGGDMIFYTSNSGGELVHYSLANGTSTVITPTALPEKCAFDPNNKSILYCAVSKSILGVNALDNWYLGLVTFSDDIWKYDLKNNTATKIEDLQADSGRNIDATNLKINSASSLLLFQSKTDGSLWSLNITAQ